MFLPEDDLNPYRNRYGDFTHTSRNGKYTFEWTPFLPAIEAWKNVRDHLQRAVADMAEAQDSQGFALNGLASRHAKMMGSLDQFTKEVQVSLEEAGKVIEVLEVAHRDYAAANEASLQQYQALMAITDGATKTNTNRQAGLDDAEKRADASADDDVQVAIGNKEPPPIILAPGPPGPVKVSGI